MALANGALIPYPWVQDPNATSSVIILDASGEKFGMNIFAPRAGNLSKVHFRTGTVTTGDTLLVSFQDTSLTTGNPDETADQSTTVVVADGDDAVWKTATMGATRTVTRGERVSVVIEYNSYVAGNMGLLCGSTTNNNIVYCALKTGGSWAKLVRSPLLVLEYDDGGIYPVEGAMFGLPTARDFNTGSTPDEIALRFSLPFPARVAGIGWFGRLSGNADLVLYTGTTALATVSLDTDIKEGAGDLYHWALFGTAQDVAASTVYRAAVKPSSATNVRLLFIDVSTAAHMAAGWGGAELYWSERTDAGSWSDTTTRRPSIFLIVEAFEAGGGGGGGPLIGGRLIG